MDRRTAIRNLALVIGSAALLPACTKTNPIARFKNFDINNDQQTLVADMAETIIPKTSTPGAIDLNLDKFVWLMLDDCTKKKDQDSFFKGMTEFTALSQKNYNKSFADCSKQEKETLLKTFENKKNTYSKDLTAFFGKVKGLTVWGYTESKYFMTKEIVYELVPGRYNAWYPVKNNFAAKNG
jgi:hypothetical protein